MHIFRTGATRAKINSTRALPVIARVWLRHVISVAVSAVKGQMSAHLSSKPCFSIFLRKLSVQEKLWVPHKECNQCVESLRMWTKGTWISWHLVYLWFGEG